MNFVCPHCRERINVEDSATGTEVNCPLCHKPSQVPRRTIQFRQGPGESAPAKPVSIPILAPPADEAPAKPHEPRHELCPQCKSPMVADAVFCVSCGYDLRTGATREIPRPGREENEPAPRKPVFMTFVIIVVVVVCLVRVLIYLQESGAPAAKPSSNTAAGAATAPAHPAP